MSGMADPEALFAGGAAGLAERLARRDVSAEEVTEACLGRIAALDPVLRAFITVDAEGARNAATEAGHRLRRGQPLGPLDGVPIAVKDNIAVAGLPCTAGVEARRGAVASEDAFAVTLLREQGAVILGTLNLHEGALGATTDNPAYGRCVNPWSSAGLAGGQVLTPGGSSGGSAAAVAAGLCAVALGTDTMGSVRIPAAYCGLFGFKPSAGRVSSAGLAHLSWSLDHIGPIARNAEDLRLTMAALATGHVGALNSRPSPDYRDFWLNEPVSFPGLSIGVIEAGVEVEPEVAEAFEAAVAVLSGLGAQVQRVKLDIAAPGTLRRAGLLIAEAEGAVAFSAERAQQGEGISPEFRGLLDWGARQTAEKLAAAHHAMLQARAAVEAQLAFQGLDLLVSPTAPQVAFAQGGRVPVNQADFTCLANLCDLPAITVPIGPGRASGLPVGLQVMGPNWSDAFLLRVALRLERAFGPCVWPPGLA